MKRYCGRDFTDQELEQIGALIAEDPSRTRTELSRLTCQALAWFKADGGLKEMSCRVAMLRMAADGLITLPPLPGAQLRYFVTIDQQIVAALGFGAAAWQTAPRDQFIGWSHEQRQNNLPLIVNNARFLILPWVKSKNLASKILAMTARRLPDEWENQYGTRPVLLETFVDTERFTGACYKVANWTYVGKTKGRGKLGPAGKQSVPIKDIWLYPLCRQFKKQLTS